MKTKVRRFNLAKYSVSVFLAASLVVLPQYGRSAPNAPNGVKIKTMVFQIQQPVSGQPVVLPDDVPAAAREAVLKAVESATPGVPVVVNPSDVPAGYQCLVDDAIAGALASLPASIGPAATGGAVPMFFQALCTIIVIVIIIIVIAIIIYVVWKACQHIPPPQTNTPPADPYPAVVGRAMDKASPKTGQIISQDPGLTLYGPDTTNSVCDIQATRDLERPDWFTLCSLALTNLVEVTNSVGSTLWALVTLSDTNGQVIASSLVNGATNQAPVLYQQKAPIRIPVSPTEPQMYFRLKMR